jgi:hypothetical protein
MLEQERAKGGSYGEPVTKTDPDYSLSQGSEEAGKVSAFTGSNRMAASLVKSGRTGDLGTAAFEHGDQAERDAT